MSGHPGARTRAHRPVDTGPHGWMDDAECRNESVDLFFGPDGEKQPEREIRERKAKTVCARCLVVAECLDGAVARNEKAGVWAGLNADELANERRKRMRRAA